jgi:hypothetical protein
VNYNIIYVRRTEWKDVDCISRAQDRNNCGTYILDYTKTGKLLINWVTMRFLRALLLKLSGRQNSVKSSLADIRVKAYKFFSGAGTDSVPIRRVMLILLKEAGNTLVMNFS